MANHVQAVRVGPRRMQALPAGVVKKLIVSESKFNRVVRNPVKNSQPGFSLAQLGT